MGVRDPGDPVDEAGWDTAAALHQQALEHLASGDLEQAAESASIAESALRALLGPAHPDVVNAELTVAAVRLSRGDAAAALVLLDDALKLTRDWPRLRLLRPILTRAHLLRADTLRQLGRYDEAVAALRALLPSVRRGESGADTYNTLGVALRFAGDLRGARRAYLAALRRVPPEDAASQATIHHNLSGLAHARGDYVQAEAEARLALERRGSLGPPDPALGQDHGALAAALSEQGRHAEALLHFEAAKAIYAQTLPADHPEVAYLLHNLGDSLSDAGDPAAARAAYDEALTRKRATFGPNHPEVAVTLFNSRHTLRALGDLDGAAARAAEARAIVATSLPEDHPIRRTIEGEPPDQGREAAQASISRSRRRARG